MKVYLDDERMAPSGFVLVRTVAECWQLLLSGQVEVLSLDHDLGKTQPSGYDLVKRMVAEGVYPRQIFLHTANPVGRENMYRLLERYAPPDVEISLYGAAR